MQDVEYGYCHCGCCEKTNLHNRSVTARGDVKGEPKRYISGHQSRKPVVEYVEEDLGYATSCWVWQRYVTKKGYGMMRPYDSKRMFNAHIVYYERVHGAVPDGKQLDHLCHDPDTCVGGSNCRHRRCVNPEHLEPVPSRENSNRGQTRPGSKHKPGRKPLSKPTHCKRGHEFTPENTIIGSDAARRCRICDNAKQRAYYHRKNQSPRL